MLRTCQRRTLWCVRMVVHGCLQRTYAWSGSFDCIAHLQMHCHRVPIFLSSIGEEMAAPALPKTRALDELSPKKDMKLQVQTAFPGAVLNDGVDNSRISDEVEVRLHHLFDLLSRAGVAKLPLTSRMRLFAC